MAATSTAAGGGLRQSEARASTCGSTAAVATALAMPSTLPSATVLVAAPTSSTASPSHPTGAAAPARLAAASWCASISSGVNESGGGGVRQSGVRGGTRHASSAGASASDVLRIPGRGGASASAPAALVSASDPVSGVELFAVEFGEAGLWLPTCAAAMAEAAGACAAAGSPVAAASRTDVSGGDG